MTTPGQDAFKRATVNFMAGLCPCGRKRNRQGNWCCRMCREGYSGHSHLCQRNNP